MLGLQEGLWFVSMEELKQAALFSIERRSFLSNNPLTDNTDVQCSSDCGHTHTCPRFSMTGLPEVVCEMTVCYQLMTSFLIKEMFSTM